MKYSVVIATMDRPADLAEALESLALQTERPSQVIVIDNSTTGRTREVVQGAAGLPIHYERAVRPGAAHQRNQGMRHVETPLVAFMDDDVVLEEETLARLLRAFRGDDGAGVGGISARFRGEAHPVPRWPLRAYYRIQAGYRERTYGGRLFGAAINALPCYLPGDPAYIPAEWLPSTCVVYRTACCRENPFPGFEGYSFMEDVYLSASVGRAYRLLFSRDAYCLHKDSPNFLKRDRYTMARQRYQNRARICRELLNTTGFQLFWKLLLHRLFDSVFILRCRQPGWMTELRGTWSFGDLAAELPLAFFRPKRSAT